MGSQAEASQPRSGGGEGAAAQTRMHAGGAGGRERQGGGARDGEAWLSLVHK